MLFHVIALCAVLLFPVYRDLTARLPAVFGGCVLHDWFALYCPLCGGTRAVGAMLRLDFVTAFRMNAYVTAVAFGALIAYIAAAVRLIRWKGKRALLHIPGWMWVTLAVTLAVWFVGRNLLMIFCGFDPTGDLGTIWNKII